MKKRNLLMGILGCGLLFTQVAKAETLDLTNVSETGQNVVVGEVETPVYSVDITWGNMEFDYVYNEVTGSFEWKGEQNCVELETHHEESFAKGWLNVYSNSTCTNSQSYESFEEALDAKAYVGYENAYVSIVDNSVRGKVSPKLYWNSEDKYDFVIGKFYNDLAKCEQIQENQFDVYKKYNMYTDSDCSELNVNENPVFGEKSYYGFLNPHGIFEYGETLRSAMGDQASIYHAYIRLENDSTKENITPVSGDTIGRITITIEAK